MEIQFRRQDEHVSTLLELTEQMQRKIGEMHQVLFSQGIGMSKYQIPELAHPITGLILLSNDREFRDECVALRKHRDIW